MNSNPIEIHTKKYVSTKESADLLNVSLGTVQKMVESGELLAWKTRGGHRRVLMTSLQNLLDDRQDLFKTLSNKESQMLGFYRNQSDAQELEGILANFSAPWELLTCENHYEGLMMAAQINPSLLFIDSRLLLNDKIFLVYLLIKNTVTRKIPILIDENFLKMSPDSIQVAAEKVGFLMPYINHPENEINPAELINHPLIYGYSETDYEAEDPMKSNYFENVISKARGIPMTN